MSSSPVLSTISHAFADTRACPTCHIQELFHQQVQERPDATALVFGEQVLSYAELDLRANRLAHLLIERQSGPQRLVGVSMQRSADMVVAMLAILKAGCAYVPLDPDYPPDRLSYMAGDCGVKTVICSGQAHAAAGGTPLDLADPLTQAQLMRMPADCPPVPPAAAADTLAYVMYTSGSTGRPKGVVITHSSVISLVTCTDFVQLGPGNVIAQASNSAFDAATFEIWGALLNGGQLVHVDKDVLLSPPALQQAIRRHRIDTMFLTTSLFHRCAFAQPDCFAGMEQLLVGGEEVLATPVLRVLGARPPARLLNVYGPTENTTFSTWCELTPDIVAEGRPVPIGRPRCNTSAHVLNAGGRPVADGEIGELYVGGCGVAQGYWARDELTAAAFVHQPEVPGERLYRTGDLVRWADGRLVFAGRADDQVKVRGFRIEPGEIETHLRAHGSVRSAVLAVRTDDAGDKQLAAYVVATPGTTLAPDELRSFLSGRLPSFMVPASITMLDALPLNANGKVDRAALPDPDLREQAGAAYLPATTPEEVILARLWEQLLGRGPIGVNDNFIACGGHSLLAMRLICELREQFGIELGFREVYSAPTLGQMAALAAQARLRQAQPLPVLSAAARVGELPLSYSQQSLWFVDQMNRSDASHNIFHALRLTGALHVPSLRAALQAVIARHETLRTVFTDAGGVPQQVVLPAAPLQLEVEPLDGGAALPAALQEECLRPFDLGRDPMLRARLWRVDGQSLVLALTMHHIAADGWSVGILLDELSHLYTAHVRNQGAPLPALAVQYKDYAIWQREWLSGDTRERALAYWTAQLAGLPLVHALPLDHPRPAIADRRGALHRSRVPAAVGGALRQAGMQSDATLFMTLHAAFAVLLARWSGADDIAVGTPVANRNHKQVEGLIGYFVNTLVLRTRIEGNPPFASLLERSRQDTLDAFEHQQLPFEVLVGALNPERALDHTPLFQVMLVLQSNDAGELALPDVRVDPIERNTAQAKFDLTLSITPAGDALELEWEYQTALFDARTVARLADSFLVLLEGIAAAPSTPVFELPLAGEAEQQRLASCAQSVLEPGEPACIHTLFERVAAERQDALALCSADERVTYRELDAWANRIAAALSDLGVGAGSMVGLCTRRSPRMVAAMLALFKLGAAYVPLDPAQPAARLDYIARDAGISLLLAGDSVSDAVAALALPKVLLDDLPGRSGLDAARGFVAAQSSPGILAYVIYTSGSTGEPKGVLVEHGAFTRLVADAQPIGYDRGTVMLQSINFAFDASVLEIWGPLLCGGQLVLYPGHGIEVAHLAQTVAELGVNTVTLPAAVLELWIEQLRGPTGLRCIVAGGEAMSVPAVQRLYALDPLVTVINHYGPTENTVLSTYYRVPRDMGQGRPMPIGYPVAGTGAWVMNGHGQLQPFGAVGELFLAGRGLARGYLNRPELTGERFVPALHGAPGQWYRTGDLVRWTAMPDGSAGLEFAGRVDQQVKVRGFRIELGEIEAQLGRCPGVQDAKVVVRPAASGERQLVGYVVPDPAHAFSAAAVRSRLEQHLPPYMLPAALVPIDRIPLTPNGKVDVRALPAPAREQYASGAFEPPQGEHEILLHRLWRELLRLDDISVTDGFFALGGHSLLLTRLNSMIRERCHVALPITSLFTAQTIRQQAQLIATMQQECPALDTARVEAHAGSAGMLSYAQQRLWFIDRLEGQSAHYNIPIRLRLRGRLDQVRLEGALAALVERHPVLRTCIAEVNGEPVGQPQDAGRFGLQVDDLSGLAAPERDSAAARIMREEARHPFDLACELMLRARLLCLAPGEHLLLLNIHHIAADGWSVGILQRELGALYAGAPGGRDILPELPLAYSDHAAWQRQYLDSQEIERQLAYWERRLDGIPPAHGLAFDRPRPAMQSYRGGLHRARIAPALLARLQALSLEHGATLFMTLQAAFALLLARWSGETDIVMGTPTANRARHQFAPLVGLFANTLVLRTDAASNMPFTGLLAQTREHTLAAFEHQDLPFEMLVDRLKPERSLSHSPLFQVLFALQNNDIAPLELPGIEVSEIGLDERVAKFDLSLSLQADGAGMVMEWEYAADLFDRATIERLAASFDTLLASIAATPTQGIHSLDITGAAGRGALLAMGQGARVAFSDQACIQHLFEQQACRTPDAVAAVFGASSLSYRDLDRRANQLAHKLRAGGVGPDVPVGVLLDRSIELVVVLLGILKAGGAYVPLDPSYPRDRLAYMAADAGFPLLIAQASLAQLAPEAGPALVLVDAPGAADWLAGWPSTPPASGTTSRNLAYVIYTSGSSGKPKGVMVEHRALVNRIEWMQAEYRLDPNDRVLQKTPYGFDVSVWEFFWPLMCGARIVLAEPDGHKDPAYLESLIRGAGVTTLHFVPSMLAAMLGSAHWAACETVRQVFCSGEALGLDLQQRFFATGTRAKLHNLYGPTEAAIDVSYWECDPRTALPSVPIGRPISNISLHVLNRERELVPVGAVGELYIGGVGLARGYLGRDDLTAAAFVPDPISDTPGARLYKTGDRARLLPDGCLEYLGRLDDQVKLRGFRIELGEIAARLQAHPLVRQAEVLFAKDGAGGGRLLAYAVPENPVPGAGGVMGAEVMAYLRLHLPAYMVPAALVLLEAFPVTANGKLDRKALPLPSAPDGTEGAAPEGGTEQTLALLWQEVLGLERVGATASFFDLGGHSLLVPKLIALVQERFGTALPIKSVFADLTVRGMAKAIEERLTLAASREQFAARDDLEAFEF